MATPRTMLTFEDALRRAHVREREAFEVERGPALACAPESLWRP